MVDLPGIPNFIFPVTAFIFAFASRNTFKLFKECCAAYNTGHQPYSSRHSSNLEVSWGNNVRLKRKQKSDHMLEGRKRSSRKHSQGWKAWAYHSIPRTAISSVNSAVLLVVSGSSNNR